MYYALWRVSAGHTPTVGEAKDRLEVLRNRGESAHAFSFAKLYPCWDASRPAPGGFVFSHDPASTEIVAASGTANTAIRKHMTSSVVTGKSWQRRYHGCFRRLSHARIRSLIVAAHGPDLSVTALYTAGVWAWSRQPGAELFAHRDATRVFRATNFALACARLYRTKPPSLRHSLVQRHVIIDRVVRGARPARVLELASGLAARGVRLSADPAVAVVEVDRPQVIARKRALAERSEAGRAALRRPNWKLHGGDLTALDLAAVVPGGDGPLAVVAEGLLMYLDGAAQAALCARVRRLFEAAGGVFVFDFVPWPEQGQPGAAGRALGWLMKRFTKGGAFAHDERSRAEFMSAVAATGFDVECIEPRAAPPAWNVPYRDVRTQQLVFVARPR